MVYVVALMSANTDINRPPFSEYWRSVHRGFFDATLNDESIDLEIIYPRGKYHDYEGILKKGVDCNPDYLVTAFPDERLAYSALKSFKNKIVAIDIPPSQDIIDHFKGQILGYVGTNPTLIGTMAAKELMECHHKINWCVIVMHDHRGNFWKYLAAMQVADENSVPSAVVYLEEDPPRATIPFYLKTSNLGVISFNTKGVEVAEKSIDPENLKCMVGVDINEHVVELIEQGRMNCAIVQQPYRIGPAAINMILNEPSSYQNVFIDPIVAREDNARMILLDQQRYW